MSREAIWNQTFACAHSKGPHWTKLSGPLGEKASLGTICLTSISKHVVNIDLTIYTKSGKKQKNKNKTKQTIDKLLGQQRKILIDTFAG